jgi:hypothetical protein
MSTFTQSSIESHLKDLDVFSEPKSDNKYVSPNDRRQNMTESTPFTEVGPGGKLLKKSSNSATAGNSSSKVSGSGSDRIKAVSQPESHTRNGPAPKPKPGPALSPSSKQQGQSIVELLSSTVVMVVLYISTADIAYADVVDGKAKKRRSSMTTVSKPENYTVMETRNQTKLKVFWTSSEQGQQDVSHFHSYGVIERATMNGKTVNYCSKKGVIYTTEHEQDHQACCGKAIKQTFRVRLNTFMSELAIYHALIKHAQKYLQKVRARLVSNNTIGRVFDIDVQSKSKQEATQAWPVIEKLLSFDGSFKHQVIDNSRNLQIRQSCYTCGDAAHEGNKCDEYFKSKRYPGFSWSETANTLKYAPPQGSSATH